ncbi:MAG: DNA mismatch repair endonuclease MutL, partial [Alphaproteobacteria bacterium]
MAERERGPGGGRGEPAGPKSRIEVLSPLVADQIAAGEVVERPASVVKELVENSLDADAHEIEVELRDGGRDWISVRDDGFGMTADDALRSCLRHATSKLRTLSDLQTIASRGFRGEALASIAAVARVSIVTRARGSAHGVRIVVAEGRIGEPEPAGAPVGTTVEVSGLFDAIPARRKFLRAPATETAHVTEALQRLALVRPDVGFACRQAGRDLFRHPAVARPEERLRQVLGAPRARTMVAVDGGDGTVRVHGFASRPGESVAQAKAVLTWVNGRHVRDRLLLRAILDAYRGVLPQGRYPVAALQVELPGSLVDVNVHPAKSEVRFAEGDAVYSVVLRAVRSAVLAAGSPATTGRALAAGASGGAEVAATTAPAPGVSPAAGGDGASRVGEALARYAVRVPPGSGAREARTGSLFVPPTSAPSPAERRPGLPAPAAGSPGAEPAAKPS